MPNSAIAEGLNSTREQMINLLNENLADGYQTVIAYTKYSQVLKGAAYTDFARELEQHAAEELQHAITIAKQIHYLSAMPKESTPDRPRNGGPIE